MWDGDEVTTIAAYAVLTDDRKEHSLPVIIIPNPPGRSGTPGYLTRHGSHNPVH